MSIGVGDALSTFKSQGLIGLVLLTGFIVGYFVDTTYYTNDSPVQPIAFSHAVHVTDNEIQCLHCHVHADKTPVAGVPSVSKCMVCHRAVVPDRPEIQKLAGYLERDEPIPWIKVHDVPDFVYFTHKRHIKANLTCQQCHGPIETMDRVTRVSNLRMPWCVDCHTLNEVENGRDCWTCHK